ncbi:UNVERIFIED_CONTAM: hypothetical protein FKN15_055350 [Acipenser sinensis]
MEIERTEEEEEEEEEKEGKKRRLEERPLLVVCTDVQPTGLIATFKLNKTLMSASPVCCGSCLATRSSATPDIRDWTISRLQIYLRSNNIPFKSTARVQQAPAVTSLATMGVQQAPIVLPSPPTITFQVTSPHCRRPAGPCSDLAGHYGCPAGPHSAPFTSNYNLSGYPSSLQASSRPLQ